MTFKNDQTDYEKNKKVQDLHCFLDFQIFKYSSIHNILLNSDTRKKKCKTAEKSQKLQKLQFF